MNLREERIFEANRAGLVARIARSGLGLERTEALFEAYDAEAKARGVDALSNAYWMEIEPWMAVRAQVPVT